MTDTPMKKLTMQQKMDLAPIQAAVPEAYLSVDGCPVIPVMFHDEDGESVEIRLDPDGCIHFDTSEREVLYLGPETLMRLMQLSAKGKKLHDDWDQTPSGQAFDKNHVEDAQVVGG